jgi:hypothetical protein
MVIKREKGAGAATRNPKYKKIITKKKKKRCVEIIAGEEQDDETDAAYGDDVDHAEDAADDVLTEEPEEDEASDEVHEAPFEKQTPSGRHIRPCICDLTESAKRRIAAHTKLKEALYSKLVKRKAEIEEEIRRKEEEAKEREREKAEQKELFGDEYEMQDGQKKRKKRSARRASMVSLGVRQVINWKKEPRIQVVFNRTWKVRHDNSRYCNKIHYGVPVVELVDYKKAPIVNVRDTHAFELRQRINTKYKDWLIASEDKRPPFIIEFIT